MTEGQRAAEVPPDDALVLTQRVAAPREVVFEFLVDPDKMLRWMGTKAELEPHPGGKFWVNVNGSDIAVGSYVEVDPPSRVVFTWGWDGSAEVPPGSSTVTMTLSADGDGTVVELRHEGLPGGAGDQHSEGWGHFLPLLADATAGD
ncbi:MAG: SRPBCC domain-containing protein [Ilumatobacter sp.]|nr:SRPBCC domain-containing protein [Ilumatobacter sp.]